MYATIKGGATHESVKLYPDLISDSAFLSRVLKYEFIFISGGLEANFRQKLDLLVSQNILKIESESQLPGQGVALEKDKYVSLTVEEQRVGREHFG
jgi:hypothetical protein